MSTQNFTSRIKFILLVFIAVWSLQSKAQCPSGIGIEMLDLRGTPGFAQTDEIVVCGAADTLAILMYLNDPGTFTNIQLELNLPTGMQYGGCATEHYDSGPTISEANKNLQSPLFNISELTADGLAVFYICVEAGCTLDPEGSLLYIDYEASYVYTDDAGVVYNCENTYTPDTEYNGSIRTPVLNVLDVSPAELKITNSTDNFCQTVLVSQDGIEAYLNDFEFMVHDLDMSVLNLVSMTANGIPVPYTYDASTFELEALIDGSFFADNIILNPATGVSDDVFQTDEQVKFEFCYNIDGCREVLDYFIDYRAIYGCNDEMCGDTSSRDGAVQFRPDFGADPTVVNTQLVQGGMFCGDNLIWSTEIASANTDPVDGLWQDLVLKWDACNTGNYTTSVVNINGQSVPFVIDGNSVVVDFTANTIAVPGLSDEDGDGFIDDLAGGQNILLEVEIEISCFDPELAASICEGNGCVIDKVDIQFKRNCGQTDQDFADLVPDIEFGYGEVAFSTNETVEHATAMGFFVTENVTSGDCNTFEPFQNGYSLQYEYGTNNIEGCAESTIYAEALVSGPAGIWSDLQYEEGSATYQGTAVPGTTWEYVVNTAGAALDTTAIRILIPMGDGTTPLHDYYFNLEARGDCRPPTNFSVAWKVFEECTDAGCNETPCLSVRSCHSVSTYITWRKTGCTCVCVWGDDTRIERCNYGWADKEMTQKLTKADIPPVDLKRFLPGDTALITTKYVLYDGWVETARKANYFWQFIPVDDYMWGTDGIFNSTHSQMLSWELHKADGTVKDFEMPNDILTYFDELEASGIAPSAINFPEVQFSNTGINDYSMYTDPDLRDCWRAQNDLSKALPNFPFAQTGDDGVNGADGTTPWFGNVDHRAIDGVEYNQYNTTDYVDRRIVVSILWNHPNQCKGTDSAPPIGYDAPSNYVDQMGIADGDTIVFKTKVPVMANPNADKGFTYRPNNIASSQGILYAIDEVNCSRTITESTCNIYADPFETHKPGPVTSLTSVVVEDCDVAVEHQLTLQNPLPDPPSPVPDGWIPWFENEYRPVYGVEYIEPFFPSNMVYLGDMIVEEANGNIVPIPGNYIIDSLSNISCVTNPDNTVCCLAADNSINASLRVVDQAYLDALDLWPCNKSFVTEVPVVNKPLDPFPLFQSGGYDAPGDPINCNFKIKYSLTSLCPAEVSSSDFGLNAQFAMVYLPDHLSLNTQSSNICNPESTSYREFLQPELIDCETGTSTYPNLTTNYGGSTYWNFGNHPEDDKDHPDRTVISEITTPDNFTGSSLDYPPLSCSVSSLLIAEDNDGSEENTYEVCAGSSGAASHTNVVTSITVPGSVRLEDVCTVSGASLNPVAAGTSPSGTSYYVEMDDLAPGACIQVIVKTELLFCPVGLDNVDTKVCIKTTSGCLDPAKAALLSQAGSACDDVNCCYEYLAEEADMQVEWFTQPARGEVDICDEMEFAVRIKNVKPAVLLDVVAQWYFPYDGLEFIPGSWCVAYEGGPTTMGAWVPIPDPTLDASGSTTLGANYKYEDDAIWSSIIDASGLEGISAENATADGNKVAFKFKAVTTCDEFTSGTPIRFGAEGSDPCGETIKANIAESLPIVIDTADPNDYAQLLVTMEQEYIYCGASPTTVSFTALNLSDVATGDDLTVCLLLPSGMDYTAGSLVGVGYTASGEEVNALPGGVTQVCFDGPAGVPAQVGSFSFLLDVVIDNTLDCGEHEIGLDIKSFLPDRVCSSTGELCGVFVSNNINTLIPFTYGPPLELAESSVYAICDADPLTDDVGYDFTFYNHGPAINGGVTVNFFHDINQNGIAEVGIDPLVGSGGHTISAGTDETAMIMGNVVIDANFSCPMIMQIEYDTPCSCSSQEFLIDDIAPEAIAGVGDFMTVCEGSGVSFEACDNWVYEVDPSSAGTLTVSGGLVEFVFASGELGPATLSLTSQIGGCTNSHNVTLVSAGSFVFDPDPITICEGDGCRKMILGVPAFVEEGSTISISPSDYLVDGDTFDPEICMATSSVTYNITITTEQGCVYTSDLPVTVIPNTVLGAVLEPHDCIYVEDLPVITADAGYDSYDIYTVSGGIESFVGTSTSNIIEVDQPGATYIIEGVTNGVPCPTRSEGLTTAGHVCVCEQIGGVVFYDNNNDGCQDDTELGVEGLEIQVSECNADGTTTPLATGFTDASGAYVFNDTDAGGNVCLDTMKTYQTSILDVPAGYSNSTGDADADADGTVDCDTNDDDSPGNDGVSGCYKSSDTDGEDGATDEHIDFGIYPCETLGGTVYFDEDINGCQEMASEGVPGVTIDLLQCNADGTTTVVGSVVTGDDGSYTFGLGAENGDVCLDPGQTYQTQISEFPEGYENTDGTSDEDGDGVVDCPEQDDDSPGDDGLSACYNPMNDDDVDGDTDEHIDFGLMLSCEVVAGVVFYDYDEDGCQADPMDGVPGVTVDLYVCNANGTATLIATTTTAEDGSYIFEGKDEETQECIIDDTQMYQTEISNLPPGHTNSIGTGDADADGVSDCAGDVDDSPGNDGVSDCYNPINDEDGDGEKDEDEDEHIDFGIVPPCEQVAGVVFYDPDGDGCQADPADGVGDVVVKLVVCNDDGTTTFVAGTTTGADGSYLFEGRDPETGFCTLSPFMTYQVQLGELPEGLANTEGTADGDGDGVSDCPGEEDDSPGDDGVSGCYNPSDTDEGDGATDEHIDFGLIPDCEQVAGVVFYDYTRDGCQGDVADGVAGVTVDLYECNSNGTISLAGTVVTGSDGSYMFGGWDEETGECMLDPSAMYQTQISNLPAGHSNTEGTGDAEGDGDVDCPGDVDDSPGDDGISSCYDPSDTDVGDGDADEHIDFGIVPGCEQVGGVVFYDEDNDGCQADAGDGVADVTVELLTCNADGSTSVVAMTTTGADGSYVFGGFDEVTGDCILDPAAMYQTQISDMPGGHTSSTGTGDADGDGEIDCPGEVDDSPGDDGISGCYDPSDTDGGDGDADEHIDFGIVPPDCEQVGGVVFYDNNNDGCQADPGDGVPDITVELLACNADGTTSVVASVMTGSDGSYLFGGWDDELGSCVLDPALTYQTQISNLPVDHTNTTGTSDADGDGLSDCPGMEDDSPGDDGVSACYDPSDDDGTDGDADEHIDFGIVPPCEQVGGVVFYDNDGDGCQSDPGDGVSDVTVELVACNADGTTSVVAMTTTGLDGSYVFEGRDPETGLCTLDPSITYQTQISDLPVSYTNTTGTADADGDGASDCPDNADDSPGDDGVSTCYDPSDIDEADGDGDEHIDFGIMPFCEQVAGVVFFDYDQDGCQEDPADGAPDITVHLYVCNADGTATRVGTTITAEDGSYVFGGYDEDTEQCILDPGVTYQTQISNLPPGTTNTTGTADADGDGASDCPGNGDDSPGDDGISGCYDPSDIDEVDGDGDEHIDFGIVPPCEQVAGVVFYDYDNDGCQADPTDGLPGVTIELLSCNADGTTSVVATTTTDLDGSYEFGGTNEETGECLLDPRLTFQTQIGGLPADHVNSTGTGDADGDGVSDCPGEEDDSPADDGVSACYDPANFDEADGDADEHIDFGVVPPCEQMSGVVFYDYDEDGCQADPIDGVPGITVHIYGCNADGTRSLVATAVTGSDGSYVFGGTDEDTGDCLLDPKQEYQIELRNLPGDSASTTGTADVDGDGEIDCPGDEDDSPGNDGVSICYNPTNFDGGDGDADEHVDFGIIPPTCEQVSGVVFYDMDNDGCQADAADGVEGVTVELLVCNADGTTSVLASVTTGFDGSYVFGGLNPETGQCWLDGTQLYGAQISDLPLGSTNSTGSGDVDGDGESDCVGDEDDSPGNDGLSACYDPTDTDVSDGDADEHIDFGIVPGCEQISGVVFYDMDNDGCQADVSDGVEGVTVELLECNADGTTSVVGSAVTGADGSYMFGGVDPSTGACMLDATMTYQVQISNLPSGHMNSTGSGDADGDGVSDCVGDVDDSPGNDGLSACYDPSDDDGTDGDADEHIDFGIVPACEQLSGVVFYDMDNDGCQADASDGVAGMALELLACNADGTTSVVSTGTTEADGSYVFGGMAEDGSCLLESGVTYQVQLGDLPLGHMNSTGTGDVDGDGVSDCVGDVDDSPGNDGLSTCYDPSDTDDEDGASDEHIDFGIVAPCEQVGGVVFYDEDKDGCQADPGDGVADVTVELYACNADGTTTLVDAVTTGSDGSYMFGGMDADTGMCLLDPSMTYQTQISDIPSGYESTVGTGDADGDGEVDCAGDVDDSPSDNGVSACYDPSDTDEVDGASDEHIDFGISPIEEDPCTDPNCSEINIRRN